MFNGVLKELSGGRVLDVGTGRGELVESLINELKDFKEIVGIDSSDAAIEVASERFKGNNFNFIKMDAANTDFEDSSFDTVCISNTLHHLQEEHMYKVLREMKRVLKPDGNFIICEMYCDNQSESQMGHVLIHHFGAELDRIKGKVHNETFRRIDILKIIEKLGLRVVALTDYIDEEETEEETLKSYVEHIYKRVEEIKEHSEYELMKEKAKLVKEKLFSTGLTGATELALVCRNSKIQE